MTHKKVFKFLCAMLSILVLVGGMPGVAFAAEQKYTVTKDSDNSPVGNFETLVDAIAAAYNEGQNDAYTIVLNDDDTLPRTEKISEEEEEDNELVEVKEGLTITLTSKKGELHTIRPPQDITCSEKRLIKIASGATLNLQNITLDCRIDDPDEPNAPNGAGILVKGGNLNLLDGLTIKNCKADSSGGGGVYIDGGGTMTMVNGAVIQNCEVQNIGGCGVLVKNGLFTMEGGRITGNGGYSGGGVYVGVNLDPDIATFIMKGGSIDGNTGSLGGGVYVSNGKFIMEGGSISGNTSSGSGGGVFVRDDGVFTMTRGVIGDYNDKSNGNSAAYGAGVYLYSGGTFILDGGTVANNATYIEGSDTVLSGNGGGVYLSSRYLSCTLNLIKGEIRNNTAQLGGGIYSSRNTNHTSASSINIEGGSISNNNADTGGGMYVAYDTVINMTGGEINHNSATSGGGLFLHTSKLSMSGGEITGNKADLVAGGIYTGKGSTVIMEENSNSAENPAIYGNLADESLTATDQSSSADDLLAVGATDDGDTTFNTSVTLLPVAKMAIPSDYLPKVNDWYEDTADARYRMEGSEKTLYTLGAEPITEAVLLTLGYTKTEGGGGDVDPNYTVTYMPNGGTGNHRDINLPLGSSYTVKSDENTDISREGYIFVGWNTNANGKGTSYKANDTLKINGNITLYAQWIKDPDSSETPKGKLDYDNHFAYIMGYPDGLVRPEADITRAEVATIFFRLLEENSRASLWTDSNDFTDVSSNRWYNTAISTMQNGNILQGYSDGSFKPDGSITRAELATITARFYEASGQGDLTGTATFSDVSGHWAEDYISLSAAAGYVHGYEDGSFRPDEPITRAEVTRLVNNVLNRHVESDDDLVSGFKKWPDNSSQSWYYFDIIEATNTHDYERKTDGKYEVWTELLENPDWDLLNKRK